MSQQSQQPQPSGAAGDNDTAPAPVTIQVDGHAYKLDLEQVIASATAERTLWWAEVLARAEAQRLRAEAAYRQWRAARMFAEFKPHPKRPEWKVRAIVEMDAQYLALKFEAAECERACVLLRELVELLRLVLQKPTPEGDMARPRLKTVLRSC